MHDETPPPPPEETKVEPYGYVQDDEHPERGATPRLRKGMGHLPAHWAADAPSAKALLGAPRGLPAHARELEKWVAFDKDSAIRDQSSTSSCVGQALARALHVLLCRLVNGAREVLYPSARWIYTLARELEAHGSGDKLHDAGSRPDLAVVGLGQRGVIGEHAFPFTDNPTAINERIPVDMLIEGYDHKVTGYHRLDSEGQSLIDDAKNALAQGYPIAMALEVDDAFEAYDGTKDIEPPKGKIYGGHYICVVGFEGDRFRCVNSWGSGWGDRGMFWMTAVALAGGSDHMVITATPVYDKDGGEEAA